MILQSLCYRTRENMYSLGSTNFYLAEISNESNFYQELVIDVTVNVVDEIRLAPSSG